MGRAETSGVPESQNAGRLDRGRTQCVLAKVKGSRAPSAQGVDLGVGPEDTRDVPRCRAGSECLAGACSHPTPQCTHTHIGKGGG